MRAIPVALALLLLGALPSLLPEASASPYAWRVETVDTRGVIETVSLALDASGNPHLAYYDSLDKDLRYARWDGSAWAYEDVDTNGTVGVSPSITVDSQGRPHIVYLDGTNEVLKHAVREIAAWRTEVIDATGLFSPSREDRQWARSVMGDTGILHACYVNNTDGTVMYARLSGTVWDREWVDGVGSWTVGFDCSIALDAGGLPHIAYQNQSSSRLEYARRNGAAWAKQPVDDMDGVRCCTAIAVNASGIPFIGYATSSPAGWGKLVAWNGTAWEVMAQASLSAFFVNLAFDSRDRLHTSDVYAYRILSQGAWINESYDAASFGALALAAGDLPRIAFVDADNSLKFAWAYATPQRPSAPENLEAFGGDGQVFARWQAPAWDGGSSVTGYVVYRGTAPGSGVAVTTLGNATSWTDVGVTNGVTYYYRVAAVNSVGEGPPSDEVTAIPSGPGDDPPSCAITSPTGGIVRGNVTVRGTATDPENSLARVEVRVDQGTWITAAGTSAWTYTWNTSALVDGPHTVAARAWDGSLYSAACSVTVTTDNGVAPPDGPDGDFLRDYGWALALLIVVLLALGILALARRRRRPAEPDQPGSP